jgi:hypothetical protein
MAQELVPWTVLIPCALCYTLFCIYNVRMTLNFYRRYNIRLTILIYFVSWPNSTLIARGAIAVYGSVF